MSTPRTPLGPVAGNRRGRGIELTPNERGRIEGLAMAGKTNREIELLTKHSRGAIRGTIALERLRQDGNSLPRSGRPLLYSIRDCRTMLRNLRLYPKLTFQQRREDTGLKMSNGKIKSIAKENGLVHWRAKKRPELTKINAANRLLWCKCRAHWDVERWRKYMWSDECSVERGSGKKQVWCFGLPQDKWKPEMVETYRSGKDIRVMVWAAFWGNKKRCPLYIMDRDFESEKHGYSANSYLEVLNA